jgi:integrase
MAHTVSVYIRESGSRNYKPAKPIHYALGTIFCIRYRQDKKRVWQTLPGVRTFGEAKHAALLKQMELYSNAPATPKPVSPVILKPAPVIPAAAPTDSLGRAIDLYLDNARATRRTGTTLVYDVTLKQFYRSCGGKELAAISKQDLIDFVRYLHAEGNRDSTIHNKVIVVQSLLKANNHPPIKFGVKYTPKPVTSYHQHELEKLFSVATKEEALRYKFFLSTGARESEVREAVWDQIDFTDKVFHIRQTEGFNPKNHENRDVPLPDFLLEELKRRLLNSTGSLIFPDKRGRPNRYMRSELKKLAQRAGLTGKFGLHEFRRTYATMAHQNGADSRSVQVHLGHASLTTTERYLRPESAKSERSRAQANRTFAQYA